MFSLKILPSLFAGSLFLVSCAPTPPVKPVVAGPQPAAPGVQPVKKPLTPAQQEEERKRQERIKANEEAKARREALAKEEEANERTEPVEAGEREPIEPPKGRYRVAMPIPGKPGFVFNPWTNKAVDVRAIPSGSKIRDPNDGDPTHIFRVP